MIYLAVIMLRANVTQCLHTGLRLVLNCKNIRLLFDIGNNRFLRTRGKSHAQTETIFVFPKLNRA